MEGPSHVMYTQTKLLPNDSDDLRSENNGKPSKFACEMC
jgi:hypothetical protein